MKIDSNTIQKCKDYNPQAQKIVYVSLLPYFNSICKRYLSDAPSRSDVLQEAFIKIFTNIGQFDINKGEFKSWTARIVINACLQHSNKIISRKETELTSIEYQIPINPDIIDRLSNEEILTVLRKMPKAYYQVFNLYIVDGFSHDEIATMLEIKTSLSRKRLGRAREWIASRAQLKSMIS
jgi:RNA polymerase sigma-70 factor (ECF subfamily)